MGDATTYNKILYYGYYQDYLDLTTKSDSVLYFCTDNGKLFKGSVDFSNSFVADVAANTPSASDAVPGLIYYETDTYKFKTKIGNALVEIGNPLDAVGDGTTHTFSVSSSDETVPSSKNVWLYGQDILSQATGGSAVVKNVAADQTTDAAIVVTYGDDSTSQVVVPGIIKSIAADQTTAGTLIVTDSAGAESNVTLGGLVHNPVWDETSLKLTLPVVDGTDIEVNIPKDIFLESGSYDATNKKIVLVLNDASSTEIEFSVSDLIPIYDSADTSTVATSITWDATNGKYIISAAAKLSDATSNVLTYDSTGLLVDGSQFADATEVADLIEAHNNLADAFTWGTF